MMPDSSARHAVAGGARRTVTRRLTGGAMSALTAPGGTHGRARVYWLPPADRAARRGGVAASVILVVNAVAGRRGAADARRRAGRGAAAGTTPQGGATERTRRAGERAWSLTGRGPLLDRLTATSAPTPRAHCRRSPSRSPTRPTRSWHDRRRRGEPRDPDQAPGTDRIWSSHGLPGDRQRRAAAAAAGRRPGRASVSWQRTRSVPGCAADQRGGQAGDLHRRGERCRRVEHQRGLRPEVAARWRGQPVDVSPGPP